MSSGRAASSSRRAAPSTGSRKRTNRLTRSVLPLGALLSAGALVLAGCGSDTSDTESSQSAGQSSAAEQGGSGGQESPAETTGVFLPPEIASNAFTYAPDEVPENSTATVSVAVHGSQTVVDLNVTGLKPSHQYGAHAHTKACGPKPSDSGPHYQNEEDPAAGPDNPSHDPKYANATNELWLDFTTDENGSAYQETIVPWTFRDGGAHALVIHAHHTDTQPGEAGKAGDRLACLDVDF